MYNLNVYKQKLEKVKSYISNNYKNLDRFLFNPNDKDKHIMDIIKELYNFENKNCKTYKERKICRYFGEYIMERYICDNVKTDRVLKDHYIANSISFEDSFELNLINIGEKKFGIDLEVKNTNILVDVKTRLVETKGEFNVYLEKSQYIKYANTISKEGKDVWLVIYYNYDTIKGMKFFKMKDLLKYVSVVNNCLIEENISNNVYENGKKKVFISEASNKTQFINFNICEFGYSIEDFISYCCK